MNKPIEGPWMLHDMEAFTVVTEMKPGRFIALCDGGQNTKEENEGNTRLILAAPDLLAALEGMARLYEEVQPAGGWQGFYDEAIAAIAKAKGGGDD